MDLNRLNNNSGFRDYLATINEQYALNAEKPNMVLGKRNTILNYEAYLRIVCLNLKKNT